MSLAASAFWNGKNVLVTGGGGFLGRWLIGQLLSDGARVTVLDIQKPQHAAAYRFETADLRSLDQTRKVLDGVSPEVIIHLAGQAGVGKCIESPVNAFESNVLCTFNLLEACRQRSGLRSIVAVSSNHIYGDQHSFPTNESAPLNGRGPYAASKLCADVLAECYGRTYQLPVVVARITNSYGGDDPHASHIVTHTILSVLNGQPPQIKQSGRDRKGYMYVKDTVGGILAAAQAVYLTPELSGEAFNLVPDEAITVKELVQEVARLAGKSVEPVVLSPDAPFEQEHLDNSKAKQVLGWSPKYSLRSGLAETLSWYKEHPGQVLGAQGMR